MLCKISNTYYSFITIHENPFMIFRVFQISGNIHFFIIY